MTKPYQQFVFLIAILLVVGVGFSFLNRSFSEKMEKTKKELEQLISERIRVEPVPRHIAPVATEKEKPPTLPENYLQQVKSLEAKFGVLNQRLTTIDKKLDQLSSMTLTAANLGPLAGIKRQKLASLIDDLNALREHIGPVSRMAERAEQRTQEWQERQEYWSDLSGEVTDSTIESAEKGLMSAQDGIEKALKDFDLSTAKDKEITEALKANLRDMELEGDCQIDVMKRDGTLLYHDSDRLIGGNMLNYRDAFRNPVWPQILEKEQGTISRVDQIRWNSARNNIAQFSYYEPLDAWIIIESHEWQYRSTE